MQEGFTMNMYGGRESLQRDCHGHYFFASNVKLTNDREGGNCQLWTIF